MAERSIPALAAPPIARDNPLTRSVAGMIGMTFLGLMLLACLGSLPWTTARVQVPVVDEAGQPAVNAQGVQEFTSGPFRFNVGDPERTARLSPGWWPWKDNDEVLRLNKAVDRAIVERIAASNGVTTDEVLASTEGPMFAQLKSNWPWFWMGTDALGRSLTVRSLTGGGISLTIGIAAALLSVFIGTVYGSVAAYAGGKVDAVMMRIVDVLFGLPYILLVVLLAVASDSMLEEYISREKTRHHWVQEQADQLAGSSLSIADRRAFLNRDLDTTPALTQIAIEAIDAKQQRVGDADPTLLAITAAQAEAWLGGYETIGDAFRSAASLLYPPREISEGRRTAFDVLILLIAIGGVSWLTMARVIRGQVLSLKAQPFMEAARAMGAPIHRQMLRHLLPNLIGPIVVYATLSVPQAILQESFLSFLGIGVKPPLPSWGNLAAEGLAELNPYKSHWWMLFFPCLFLATTLLALNFVGEGLREAFDPKRARR
jgi:ABC-type dipeptide/oligopeptide/nickel transport system permease subunit